MKRYPEYKESGVEWIGGMPRHWEVLKVKRVGLSNPSKNNPKTTCLKNQHVVFLPMERVHTDGTIDQELRLPYSQLKNGYTYFEEGDILIAKVTPCFENGKIVHIKNLATSVGFGSTEFIVIRPDLQTVFPPFLYYILRSKPLRGIGKHFMTSAVGLKRVPTEFVENFRVPIPAYQEQTQIANFLDQKTEHIDELIRIKERQIELLQEQRTTLINQVVTKGLDPNVEMKPSGVEWIGGIPKHWVAKKLMYFCSMKSGNGFSHDLQGRTGLEIPFFKVSDTNTPENKVEMLYAQHTVSSQDVSDFKFILHKPNSIVFPKVGAALLLNKRNVLAQKSCIDNNMMSLYSNQSNHKFLYYAMLNVDFKRHYRAGGAVPSINESEVGNIPIAYPTHSEQVQIANFLDHKTGQIDELITTEQRKIELLKEYRQSLISEAVTGKIDVRNEV